MKSMTKLLTAATVAALSAGAAFAVAAPANAAPTTPATAITNDPNASNGSVAFYDSTGAAVTRGNDLTHLFDYALTSTAGRAAATKATLYFAFPNSAKSNSTEWFRSQKSLSTEYPNSGAPASLNAAKNPLVTLTSNDGNLKGLLATTTQDQNAGYAGILQVRVYDSGDGAPVQQSPFWASDIYYDESADTWQQVYPSVPSVTATSTTVAASPVGPQTASVPIAFTAGVTPKVAGSVQFKDGSATLGSPVDVAAGAGVAQLPATTLAKGTHPITAVFTPTDTTAYATSTSTSLTYVIADPPGDPTNVAAKPVNQTATVTWTAPSDNGGTPLTGYDVQYSVDGTTWTSGAFASRTSTATSAVVTGLANGTGYLFRVRSINGVGSSSFQQTTTKVSPVADATAVTISAPRTVRYTAAATVSAVVTDARDHSRVGRVPVSLYRRVAGQRAYSVVRTVTTSASGVASYRLAVSSSSAFYWHYNGNAAHKAVNSRAVTVAVTPTVSIAVKGQKVKHGKSTKVYGGATPAPSGERVYLQRLLKGKWSNQASTTIHRQKLPNGRTRLGYVFSRKLTKKGSYVFRVITAATAYSTAGTTGRLTVRAT